MKQFACTHVVDGCPGVVTGESDDEVLAAAAAHAAEAHDLHDLPPEVVETVRANIVDA